MNRNQDKLENEPFSAMVVMVWFILQMVAQSTWNTFMSFSITETVLYSGTQLPAIPFLFQWRQYYRIILGENLNFLLFNLVAETDQMLVWKVV